MVNSTTSDEQSFIETEMGILTQTGDWFHTNTQQIESFAPGLLDEVPLKKLIRDAQAWVQSAGSLSLLLLYILLFGVNPWIAALFTLSFHWLWYQYKSGFIVRGAGRILRVVNSDVFAFIIAFISLTLLGFYGQYAAVGIGIVFFFLMKPGLLKKVWDRFIKYNPDELTLNDRVLKMIIIREAMHENLTPANIQKMEEKLRSLAFNRKKGKK